MGLNHLQSDPQLFLCRLKDDFVINSTHVDDFLIISRNSNNTHATLDALRQTYPLTTKDDPTTHLGLHIKHEFERSDFRSDCLY